MGESSGNVYQVFEQGSYLELMPQLIEAGLTPMGVPDIMKTRIDAFNNTGLEQKNLWLNHCLDTGTGIVYHPGKIRIVQDSQLLRDVHPGSELIAGKLALKLEDYAYLDGEDFSRRSLKKAGLYRQLKKSEVLSHPVWQALAGDDDLLREYADVVFAETKEVCGQERAMKIYLGAETKEVWAQDYLDHLKDLTMGAWFIYPVAGGSNIFGHSSFGLQARLVGVRS